MLKSIALILVMVSFSFFAKASDVNVKYKSGKRIDFESLLIEGEAKKADYSVVTGNLGEEDFGLLRLRDDFTDMMAIDAQEEIQ